MLTQSSWLLTKRRRDCTMKELGSLKTEKKSDSRRPKSRNKNLKLTRKFTQTPKTSKRRSTESIIWSMSLIPRYKPSRTNCR